MKKLIFAIFVTVFCLYGYAQERSSTLTGLVQRGEALAEFESVSFFEVQGAQHWVVEHQARGVAQGSVLMIADRAVSANGNHYLASLRQSLPNYGWSTHFFNESDTAALPDLIQAVKSQATLGETLLLMCEATSCDTLRAESAIPSSGLVFINVPYTKSTRVVGAQRQAWSEIKVPTLVLQEHPRDWPVGFVLPTGFELHLLPPGQASQDNSRVLRKIRGWLKRSS